MWHLTFFSLPLTKYCELELGPKPQFSPFFPFSLEDENKSYAFGLDADGEKCDSQSISIPIGC